MREPLAQNEKEKIESYRPPFSRIVQKKHKREHQIRLAHARANHVTNVQKLSYWIE